MENRIMDAITRAQLNEHASRQQTGLPLTWLVAICGAWFCIGLIFMLWSPLVGAGVIVLGIAVTGLLYFLSSAAPEPENLDADIPTRTSAKAQTATGFVALGDTDGSRPASFSRPNRINAPPIPRSVPEERPETSFKVFAAKNPKLLIQAQRQFLENLRKKTETDIIVLEPVLRARLHKNRKEELEGFLQAQKIVQALSERVAEIDQAYEVEDWNEDLLRQFWTLCYGKLELKTDAMSTLAAEDPELNQAKDPGLTTINCEARLKEIFKLLKRRQTFFRALQDQFRL